MAHAGPASTGRVGPLREHPGPRDVWRCYPGDAWVDVVGIDPYDHHPPSPTAAEFDRQCRDRHGLRHLMDVARARGKTVGVGEWGVIDSGIGDNALHIRRMFETFRRGRDVLAYETYVNSAPHGTALDGDANPRSSAAHLELFGGSR